MFIVLHLSIYFIEEFVLVLKLQVLEEMLDGL